jgi:heme exporter protein D
MKGIYRRGSRGVVWVGKAVLFCSGLLAMFVLVVVMTVLTAVMLTATILPAVAGRQKRDLRRRRDGRNTSGFPAPRTVVASRVRQGR